jgi:DsbC/DsbD-like thiol-disulfide interchange protein
MTRAASLVLACCLAAGSAAAQFAGALAPVEARLLPGFAEGEARMAGLRLALEPGWKTYWRTPGDAGIAPQLDWSGSSNVAAVEPIWPTPHLFETFGVATVGYKGEVTVPLRVTPVDAAEPMRLRLVMDYGLCSDLCIPARAELALDLAPGAPEAERAAIAAALDDQPLSAEAAGVSAASCALRGAGEMRAFEAEIDFERAVDAAPHVVIEGPEGVWFGPATVSQSERRVAIAAEAQIWGEASWVARDALRLTLLFDGWAADLPGCGA